jgi:hypothetical protein
MFNVLYCYISTFQSVCVCSAQYACFFIVPWFRNFPLYCSGIITVIIIIIIMIELITLFNISLLGNLHLYRTVSVIRHSQERKIILSPKVKGIALGILVLYVTFFPLSRYIRLNLYSVDIVRSFWWPVLPLRTLMVI